jgi:uncharacterized membrane protein
MLNRLTTQQIISNGLLAAIYVILTLTPPLNTLSFFAVQFRVSEALLFLIFFRKDFVIGIVVGTFISNLFGLGGAFGIIDAFAGSAVSLMVGLIIGSSKRYELSMLSAVILNAIYVGLLIMFLDANALDFPIFLSVAISVALGQLGVLILLSLPLYYLLRSNAYFLRLVGATQNVR